MENKDLQDIFLKYCLYNLPNLFVDYINFNIVEIVTKENIFNISCYDKKLNKNILLKFNYNFENDNFDLLEIVDNIVKDKFEDDNIKSLNEIEILFQKFILQQIGSYQLTLLDRIKLRNIIIPQIREKYVN